MIAGLAMAGAVLALLIGVSMARKDAAQVVTNWKALAGIALEPRRRAILLLAFSVAAVFLWFSWLERYELVVSQDHETAVVFRLDRWTGAVEWCTGRQCTPFGNLEAD